MYSRGLDRGSRAKIARLPCREYLCGDEGRPHERAPRSFFEPARISQVPVLVDFWAEWCGPCRIVSPTIERLARENLGRILTVKVNVDRRPQVAQAFEIQGIPTIMLFCGEPRMRLTGAYPYEAILQNIQENWPHGAGVRPISTSTSALRTVRVSPKDSSHSLRKARDPMVRLSSAPAAVVWHVP